jgi:glycine amidinotransferase
MTDAATNLVSSWNEWDPLEEVIVGTVTGAVYPEHSPVLAAGGEPEWLWHYQGEFIEEEYVDKANAQLDALVKLLEGEGIVVRRPDPMPLNLPHATPYWQSRSSGNTANPRDLFLVVGDSIIECASPIRHRQHEALAYRRLLTDYFRAGARLESAPRPALRDPLYDHGAARPHVEDADDPDAGKTLADGEEHHFPIREHEVLFEAADFVRCGRDLFVQRSCVTNQLGIDWVRRHLGDGFRVHEIETRCSAPNHIDTTLVPLAPGKVLVNPSWVKKLPDCFDGWDVLEAPAPSYAKDSPMAYPYFTSQWLSMNVLSLDDKRVLVDRQQVELIRLLAEHGLEPVPLDFDYMGLFGGSFHCATLDVRRRGELASYF